MNNQNELRRRLNNRFQDKQDRIVARPGKLGNGHGIVKVPSRSQYVYVRLAESIDEVFNNKVPPENDLLVMVGNDPTQPDLYQVLSTRSASPYGETGGGVTGYAPARRYQWMAKDGGEDPLWVELRQILPLRIGVYAGLFVQVYRGFVLTSNGFRLVEGQAFDLTSFIPTTEDMTALVLITIDDAGLIVGTKGMEVADDYPGLGLLPEIPEGTVDVLGAVRVYYGQKVVVEGRTDTDIIDLRFTGFGSGGSGGITNPMTAQDDLIVGGASGTPARLEKGNDSDVLTVDPVTHHLAWKVPPSASGFNLGWFDVVTTYGADPTGTADSTTAVQNAINAAATAGGGVIYFRKGIYKIAGVLQDTSRSNCQVKLPAISTEGGYPITIVLLGEVPAMQNYWAWGVNDPSSGVIIRSTLASGTGSLLGGWGPSGSDINISWITAKVENILFETVANPTISGLDFSHVASVELRDVIVNAGGHYDLQDMPEPTTSTSHGIRLPENSNGAFNRGDGVTVMGFYYGMEITEHFIGDNISLFSCKYATKHIQAGHSIWIGRILIQWCQYGLSFFSGVQHIIIGLANFERYTATNRWAGTTWFEDVADIYDPNNYAVGHLFWHALVSGTQTDDTIVVNGGGNLHVISIHDFGVFEDPTTDPGDMIYRGIVQSLSGNLALLSRGASIFSSSGHISGYPAENAIDGNDDSYWAAWPNGTGATVWITIDLGVEGIIYGYRLRQPWAADTNEHASKYKIYYSDDHVAWTELPEVTASSDGIDVVTWEGTIAARYWSFSPTEGVAVEWVVRSIELYTSGSPVTGLMAIPIDDGVLKNIDGVPTWEALSHADLSDFDTQVRTSRLDQMAAPTADVSINSHNLTDVSDPASAQDAATKAYVDTAVAGGFIPTSEVIEYFVDVASTDTGSGYLTMDPSPQHSPDFGYAEGLYYNVPHVFISAEANLGQLSDMRIPAGKWTFSLCASDSNAAVQGAYCGMHVYKYDILTDTETLLFDVIFPDFYTWYLEATDTRVIEVNKTEIPLLVTDRIVVKIGGLSNDNANGHMVTINLSDYPSLSGTVKTFVKIPYPQNYGNVSGPDAPVTDGHVALWDGTTGKKLKDGGAPTGTGNVMGTDTATDGNLIVFDADGYHIKDGGSAAGWTQGAFVYMSGNQLINNGAYPALAWNSEQYDTDSIHDNSSNNTRLTCQTAGKYQITANIRFAANATGYRQAYFQITHGSTVYYPASVTLNAINGVATDLCLTCQFNLAANDYVEVYVTQNSGSNINVTGGAPTASPTSFSMQRIG